MKRAMAILLLAAGTAFGQIENPPQSADITDATATGRAVLTAANAAAAATAIGLGANNSVFFNAVEVGQTYSYSAVIGEAVDGFLHIATLQQGEIQIGWGSDTGDYELAATLEQAGWSFHKPFAIANATNRAITRTNLGLGLPALTNTSNVTIMRTLAGSTNTNHPFSGNVSVGTNSLVFSNGILLNVQ